METQHNTYEAQLRQDLDARGVELAAVREEVKQLRLTLEDRDRTIARFRDATTRLAVRSTHTHTHAHPWHGCLTRWVACAGRRETTRPSESSCRRMRGRMKLDSTSYRPR